MWLKIECPAYFPSDVIGQHAPKWVSVPSWRQNGSFFSVSLSKGKVRWPLGCTTGIYWDSGASQTLRLTHAPDRPKAAPNKPGRTLEQPRTKKALLSSKFPFNNNSRQTKRFTLPTCSHTSAFLIFVVSLKLQTSARLVLIPQRFYRAVCFLFSLITHPTSSSSTTKTSIAKHCSNPLLWPPALTYTRKRLTRISQIPTTTRRPHVSH